LVRWHEASFHKSPCSVLLVRIESQDTIVNYLHDVA